MKLNCTTTDGVITLKGFWRAKCSTNDVTKISAVDGCQHMTSHTVQCNVLKSDELITIWKYHTSKLWTTTTLEIPNLWPFLTENSKGKTQFYPILGINSSVLVFAVSRGQFHQCSTSSSYKRRSQKRKRQSSCQYHFALLGSAHIIALSKHVDEIDPRFLWNVTPLNGKWKLNLIRFSVEKKIKIELIPQNYFLLSKRHLCFLCPNIFLQFIF